ncbi:hypothetical protein [Streptomyces griseorubiginosus]|uniref:hypothetical protein n=1 Tax=Streptomyces griseorubiginosus TaxID=67304 RepID=UPI0036E5F289
MTELPRPVHTHVWNGGPLPAWLDGHYHDDYGRLIIHTPDGDARPEAGWTFVGWSDGTVTVASPTTAARVYSAEGLAGRLTRAEATVQRVTVLDEQWIKAGPPPLGVPLARWWDRRLIELRRSLESPKER